MAANNKPSALERIKNFALAPGRWIGEQAGSQAFGTGFDAQGNKTGQPLNPRTLPGQAVAAAGQYLNAEGRIFEGMQGIGKGIAKGAAMTGEYLTGANITEGGPVNTPPAVAPNTALTTPAPQSATAAPEPTYFAPETSMPATTAPRPTSGSGIGQAVYNDVNFLQEGYRQAAGISPAPAAVTPNPPARNDLNLVGFRPAYEGQSLSDWMAGRDRPEDSTVQANDFQGRLRRFDSPAAVAANLDAGQAAYDAASEARSNGITFRRDDPNYAVAPSNFNRAVSDAERRGELPFSDYVDMAGGNRRAARALQVQARNGLDPISREERQFDRQLEAADYRAGLERENADYRHNLSLDAQENRARLIEEASDRDVIDQANAIRQANGQEPITDPADARAELFSIAKNRITSYEQALESNIGNMNAYQNQQIEQAYSAELEANPDLAEKVEQYRGLGIEGTTGEILNYIANQEGNEAAAGIVQRAPETAMAILSEDPEFANMQRQSREIYNGLIREVRETPGVSTQVGVPQVEPYQGSFTPEQMAEVQRIIAESIAAQQ